MVQLGEAVRAPLVCRDNAWEVRLSQMMQPRRKSPVNHADGEE